MFGFPRLMTLMGQDIGEVPTIEFLLNELTRFSGPDWEQEDDVTLVTVERVKNAGEVMGPTISSGTDELLRAGWRLLDEFTVPSEPGNERLAIKLVDDAVRELGLSARRLEQLKTAVAEATMNAMEHGNHYRPEMPVQLQVLASPTDVLVRVTDHGGSAVVPDPETPDIEAKLAEQQTPRGWGLFLIKNLVDEMHVTSDATHHTIELKIALEGEHYGH
jgi:anti-sigma regulatory factor (Ser/Thr protein kinase)